MEEKPAPHPSVIKKKAGLHVDHEQGLNLLGGIIGCCEQCSLPCVGRVDNGSDARVLAGTSALLLFETLFAKEARERTDC